LGNGFIKSFNPKIMITSANARYSTGGVYKKLGFRLIGLTAPNYFYVKNTSLFSRIKFQKHKLKDQLDFYNEKLTESENMFNNPLFNGNLSSVKKMIKKYKIKIPSITCDYFMQEPFFKIDKKKIKNKIIDKLKKIIRNGNRIGIKYYIFPLVDNGSIKSLAEENILIKETKKLLKLLNKKALILFETDYPPCEIALDSPFFLYRG
jgi:hypothetical protein